jgi:hypothetical protein
LAKIKKLIKKINENLKIVICIKILKVLFSYAKEVFMENRKIKRCIYDPHFKSIFIENPNALASLISSITGIDYNLMKNNLTIKTNEIPINGLDEKFKRTDFLITFDNYIINVEANGFKYDELKSKNTSYAMEVFAENTKSGKDYNTNLVLIQINLNAFSVTNKILAKYYISDPETGEIYLQNFIFYALDIAKSYKLFYNTNEKDITNYIRWGAFLYSENLSELDNILGNMLAREEKEKLIRKVDEINMRRDGTLTKKEAEEWGKFIEESLKREGYNEGIEQGIEQGIEKGIEQGKNEMVINTVKSMLSKKMSYEDISDIVGKSIDEIKEIENSKE